jgi:hypothetical protein
MSTLSVTNLKNAASATNNLVLNPDGLYQRFHEVLEYRDGDLYWKVTLSNVAKAGKKAGCERKSTYASVMVDKKAYCKHIVVFCMHHGYIPEQIDHIDQNRKNSRIENLRAATNASNNMNKTVQSNSKSGIKNVCWSKQNKKWWVQVSAYGKKVVSKMFDDLELAELVAIMAREKYHGAFANHGTRGVA